MNGLVGGLETGALSLLKSVLDNKSSAVCSDFWGPSCRWSCCMPFTGWSWMLRLSAKMPKTRLVSREVQHQLLNKQRRRRRCRICCPSTTSNCSFSCWRRSSTQWKRPTFKRWSWRTDCGCGSRCGRTTSPMWPASPFRPNTSAPRSRRRGLPTHASTLTWRTSTSEKGRRLTTYTAAAMICRYVEICMRGTERFPIFRNFFPYISVIFSLENFL